MARVRRKYGRVKSSVIEVAVIIKPDLAHAASRCINSAKLRRLLGNDLPNPLWPGADITNKPAEIVNGIVELPVEIDAFVGRCLDPLLEP